MFFCVFFRCFLVFFGVFGFLLFHLAFVVLAVLIA